MAACQPSFGPPFQRDTGSVPSSIGADRTLPKPHHLPQLWGSPGMKKSPWPLYPSWWMAPPVRQQTWGLDKRKRAAQEQLRAQSQREEELSAKRKFLRKRRRLESLAGEVEDLRADLAGIVQRLRAVERRLSVGAVVIDLCDG